MFSEALFIIVLPNSFTPLSYPPFYQSRITDVKFIIVPMIILNKTRRFFVYFVKFALLKYSFYK